MKKHIFDILIGLMLGIIFSFVTMMIIDGRTAPDSVVNETDSSYGVKVPDDVISRNAEQTEVEESSSDDAEAISVSEDSAAEATPAEEAYDYESFTDYFRQCDPNWNESYVYQEAVKAYENCIGQATVDEINWSGQPRFEFAYIDEDDIP